jgi:hypothetical protein
MAGRPPALIATKPRIRRTVLLSSPRLPLRPNRPAAVRFESGAQFLDLCLKSTAAGALRLASLLGPVRPRFRPSGTRLRLIQAGLLGARHTVITKGLLACGAMGERAGLPVTSSVPRYALMPDFAALFDPALTGAPFEAAAEAWRATHLTKVAIGRIALARKTMSAATAKVPINFPGGGGIVLPEGPSPAIIKAVVEEFGPRFLGDPQVLWISDSR